MALSFGTSGLRGPVVDFTSEESAAYAFAFVEYLRSIQISFSKVVLAGDLRSSTPQILGAVHSILNNLGLSTVFIGFVPTPCLALYCQDQKVPGIMVTGSHLPDDRNGIKFYKPTGEILKADEIGISRQRDKIKGLKVDQKALPSVNLDGQNFYMARYLEVFPPHCLTGLKVGLYEHSAVGRDLLRNVLSSLGAQIVSLERSNHFIAVDTEAVENVERLKQWIFELKLDCLVSTDGDSDRPLLVDDESEIWGGDQIGIITAQALGAKEVVTPISSTGAIELSPEFETVVRTKIGSPFVIEAMEKLMAKKSSVVAFEANGGFLMGSPLGGFSTLMTRDAFLPLLMILTLCKKNGKRVSDLRKSLPKRFNRSGLIRGIESPQAQGYLAKIGDSPSHFCRENLPEEGPIESVNTIDGIKILFANFRTIHFRPSGNAPEFRIYAEAESDSAAEALREKGLHILAQMDLSGLSTEQCISSRGIEKNS